MIQKSLRISKVIEARDIALLVQTASKFTSIIKIELRNKVVNAKSIMGLIALGTLSGQDVTVLADGNDEEVAVKEISEFLTR